MMRVLFSASLACTLALGLVRREVSVSFVPGLSTNGSQGGNVVSHLSFNVIGGYIGSVEGFELGSVFNIDRLNSSGCQIAGALNVTGGRMRGTQIAPVNFTGQEFRGAQVGCVNIAGNVGAGAQVGVVNITTDVNGTQVSCANISRNVWGVQVGNANIASMLRGVQVGNANVTGDFRGLLIGNANVAGAGTGFLLGNVNVCGELDGEALGNVSIIGNGYQALSLWADETGIPQVGAKLGSRHVYNVFGVGLAPLADSGMRWLLGYGLGGHFPLNRRMFVDADLTAYAATSADDFPLPIPRARKLLAKLRPQFGWGFAEHVAVVAGPTFTFRLTSHEPIEKLSPFRFGHFSGKLSGTEEDIWYEGWAGLMLGIQYR